MWSHELSVSISLLTSTAFRASEDEIQTGLPWSESLTKSDYNHSCSCTKLSWFGKAGTVEDCLWHWWEKLEQSLCLCCGTGVWVLGSALGMTVHVSDCSVSETEVEIPPAKKDVTAWKNSYVVRQRWNYNTKEISGGYAGAAQKSRIRSLLLCSHSKNTRL